MATKKSKTTANKPVYTSISLILPYNDQEGGVENWLKAVKDFSEHWSEKVECLFIDLTDSKSLKAWLQEESAFETLKEKCSVQFIEDVNHLGFGYQRASQMAQNDHLLIWSGDLSVKPRLVNDWVNKYKQGFPADSILFGKRDFTDKAYKKAVREQEGKGVYWFQGFTNTRIEDPGNPLKIFPKAVAKYFFHQIKGNSSVFEAEVLHQAEMEGVEITGFETKVSGNENPPSLPKATKGAGIGRALAFKWNYQVKQPLKGILKKQSIQRPEVLKPAHYGFRLGFTVLLVILFLGMPLLSFDYGVTGDEKVQDVYGQKLVDYYTSFGEDESLFEYRDLKFYGGLFETFASGAANIVQHYTDENYRYETRHVLNAIVGFLAILITALFGKYFGGWRGGLLALLFLVLSPRFFGHAMNNPKDIPFAAFYLMGIYFMMKFLKEFPKPTKRVMVWLIVAIACALSIRIGGLLLIAYFGLFVILDLLRRFITQSVNAQDRSALIRKAIRYGLIVILLGYLGGMVFWPYGHQNPFLNPYNALQKMADFPVNISILFEGEMIKSRNIPWTYIFKYLFYTTPLFGLAGFAFFIAGVPFFKKFKNAFYYGLILFSVVFPIVYIIYKGSNLYDGIRQVLFIYPPFVLLAALSFNHLFEKFTQRGFRIGLGVVLTVLMVLPLTFMVKSHPNQYIYFNEFVGGVKGAFGNYELDYWGNSTKQASHWLGKNFPGNGKPDSLISVKSNFTEGTRPVLKRYSDSFGVSYVSFKNRSKESWDYAIFVNRFIPPQILNNYWPPTGTIHEVEVEGKAIAVVIKRPSSHDYKGFQHLNNQQFEEAIEDFEKYLKKDSTNVNVLTALSRSYLRTQNLNKAFGTAKRALRINPDNPRTLGILGNIYKQQNQLDKAARNFERAIRANRGYASAYLQLGQIYYQKRQPRRALQYLKVLRQISPRLYKRAQRLVKKCRQMMRQ